MTTRALLIDRWYCPTGTADAICRNYPCHGHRVTRDQLLVAKVMAFVEGRDWDTVYQSERRERMRRAHVVLRAVRQGEQPEQSGTT